LFLLKLPAFNYVVEAEDLIYYINHQWVKIWINKDGTIDLFYDVEIVCIQGNISRIDIGQPYNDFYIGWARDKDGRTLITSDVSSGDYYAVRVHLHSPIFMSESARIKLMTNVGHMIWEDEHNLGNVGIEFIPTWWSVIVKDLRVSIVLPQGVTTENVKNTPDWNNSYNDPDESNSLVLFWERKNMDPDQKFSIGVSFPKEFVEHYEIREKGPDWTVLGMIIAGTSLLGIIAIIFFIKISKKNYILPKMRMETMGVRRGLTAIEASHLLDLPPVKIVAEILFSLLMKKAIWIKAKEPIMQVEIVRPFEDNNKVTDSSLRYYEIGFLRAIKKNGTLEEVKLVNVLMLIRDTGNAKLHGYCMQDTIKYYSRIVAKAWKQVEQADTPELASKAYDKNLLWLLLDKNIQSETDRVFKDRYFIPDLNWWWYWYIFTRSSQKPVSIPQKEKDGLPTIPGAELADKIVVTIEHTANNIVSNIEKFANSILPSPTPQTRVSRSPTRRGASCVCACAACACACACVSCACACASGGAG
jgi:hypothetical protein